MDGPSEGEAVFGGLAMGDSASDRDRAGAPHRRLAVVVALYTVLALALFTSAPALAASHGERALGFTFGEGGTGAGQLSYPSGVAVSSATGDVYVGDREAGKIDEFEPELSASNQLIAEKIVGEFTLTPEKENQRVYPEQVAVDNCTTAASEPCTAAEDPSVGDLYVVAATGHKNRERGEPLYIYKLTASGEAVGKPFKLKTAIQGIAVDSTGKLFVYEQGVGGAVVVDYGDDATSESKKLPSVTMAVKGEARPPFAVEGEGAGDEFYIGHIATEEAEGPAESAAVKGVLAELARTETTLIGKAHGGTGELLLRDLDYESASAVAVDEAEGEVFAENVAAAGDERLTSVSVFSPAKNEGPGAEGEGEGTLIERFAAPGLQEGSGIAVDGAAGTPSSGAVFLVDGPSDDIEVFQIEPTGKPSISGVSSQESNTLEEGPGATKLVARVATDGAATTAYFEYGIADCASSPCTKTASSDLSGVGDQEVGAELAGLAPGVYRYRLVAENEHGRSESDEQSFVVLSALGVLPDGRKWEMVSPPSKHGAEPEPPTKEGGVIQAAANGDGITYVGDGPFPYEPEPEGNRGPNLTQIISRRDTSTQTWVSQDITTPNETAAGTGPGLPAEYHLFSPDLALSLLDPYPAFSGPYARPPLAPALEGEEPATQQNTFYLRDDALFAPEESEQAIYEAAEKDGSKMHNPGYIAIVNKTNTGGPGEPGSAFGGNIEEQYPQGVSPAGASPNLAHIVFRSERESAKEGLYEWSEGSSPSKGKIELVSVLPNGEAAELPVEHAYLGGSKNVLKASADVRHAVSNNGKRVFWTYESTAAGSEEPHLELRETETEVPETLQLDTPQEGVQAGEGVDNPVFQTANEDGSKVFFTDEQRLTPDSGAREGAPDLYVAELEIVAGKMVSTLTDLTPKEGEDANVLVLKGKGGGVIGASEDGSYVYFAANGALAPGATRGHCANAELTPRPAGTTCSLYVRHFDDGAWEPIKLVATVSYEDSPDWGGATDPGDLGYMTSRVSPNGRYLAFMSNRSLTGFDNEDASGKGRRDEEVFLYDDATASLVCVSCDPNGTRPHGVFEHNEGFGDGEPGFGLEIDKTEIWAPHASSTDDHWVAGDIPGWDNLGVEAADYQSRYLSNSGRLYFNSADALAPVEKPYRTEKIEGSEELQVGVENVYEYEPDEVGSCHGTAGCIGLISSGTSEHESVFLDASESGDDVFFLTAKALTSQDVDGNFDVYDAHVCEEASPCLTPPVEVAPKDCQDEAECQGAVATVPATTAEGTAAFSGSGNLVPAKIGVLGVTETKAPAPAPKPLTRAQKLAKALKTCKKDKKKSKRISCEKQARKQYGPIKAKAKKSSTAAGGR
jgi:hypothetical protein